MEKEIKQFIPHSSPSRTERYFGWELWNAESLAKERGEKFNPLDNLPKGEEWDFHCDFTKIYPTDDCFNNFTVLRLLYFSKVIDKEVKKKMK